MFDGSTSRLDLPEKHSREVEKCGLHTTILIERKFGNLGDKLT